MPLIYSDILGLRVAGVIPPGLAPDTYVRTQAGWLVRVANTYDWQGSTRQWADVQPDCLPKRLKTEALLLGVVL